ncbi:MAG: DegV family protein [Firmicutes bacterium]|nr:DegV family protein [Bacillota bacterium]
MKKTAVVTDSNSGISQQEAQELGLYVLPLPFTVGGQLFFEGMTLTQELFYQKLDEGCEVSTSQPSLGSIQELWDSILVEYDEIVHLPMSSGFSSSYASAMMLAQEYGGKVQVVDSLRISITQRQAVLDAQTLIQAGWEAVRIKEYLEGVKMYSSIYMMVDTMKYLKKSGRVSPTIAAISTILNIKPILCIKGAKIDVVAKARGIKQATDLLIKGIQGDLAGIFKDFAGPDKIWLKIAYSLNKAAAETLKTCAEAAFPGHHISIEPLSFTVVCHAGPGTIAITCCKKLSRL